jgi:replicative DNA helicase
MMLSKDAIADVLEILKAVDFYRPAHGVIFDAVLDLYGRGEPADAITVAAALADSGDLGRVGGAPYLHTLISSVPTAANAAYYARIVSERAILRRLIEAGTRIVQLGYGSVSGAGRDVDDLVDLAQQAVYDVTERRVSEDFAVLSDLLQPTLDEIEAVGAQGGVMTGVPTGFTDLDRLLNGLHPGQLIIVAGRPGLGKALALDTALPTADGWTTMGEVKVGDQLIGADGQPTTVVATSEIMLDRPCYEVEFSDDSVIVADAEHLWVTWDGRTRKTYDSYRHGKTGGPPYPENWATWSSAAESKDQETVTVAPVTTAEMAATLRYRRQPNHAIPVAAPVRYAAADLPIDPYVLGYLLGDGDTAGGGSVACDPRDREWLIKEFDRLGYRAAGVPDPGHFRVKGVRKPWRSMGLAAGTFIPAQYLYSSIEQRTALVQGLLDSDGAIDGHGAYRFANTNRALVDGFRQLVTSLGCVSQLRHLLGTQSWEVIVPTSRCLARLPRKLTRARSSWGREQVSRYVTDVRQTDSVPVRCVTVDNDDHLYLAGRSMIPTHNSTAAMDFARATSVRGNLSSAIFSLEMSKVEIVMRLLSAEARVPLHVLRSGQLSDDDWTKLARRMGEISEAPLFVDDTPNMNLMEIRAKARRLKQRHDLKLIIVDYLQLMTSPKRVESRQQEVAELSRGLKLLAKEVECPVVAVSQLNRGPEQRTDKRPQLSDLRESGSIEQDADVVILLHRDDYYDRESPRAGEADFIVAKHRNGPTDTITVAAQLHLSRFVDMAVV